MSKKSGLHELTPPAALPAQFLSPGEMHLFGKTEAFWFPCAGIWLVSPEKKDLN